MDSDYLRRFPLSRAIPATLTLIILVALASRGMRSRFGLPYLQHWDEPEIVRPALATLKTGDWNPHRFHYGALLVHLNILVDVAHYFYLVGLPEEDPDSLASPEKLELAGAHGWPWEISHPSFALWNRWLTALFGTACVALAFFFGNRLSGPAAGLLAAIFLATLGFHIDQSAFATADVPASFLALGAIALSWRFLDGAAPGSLIAALAAAGLAASTKYNAAICFLAPALALGWAAFRSRPGYRSWLWICLPLVPATAFLLAMPYAVTDLPRFLADAGFEIRHYLVDGHGELGVEPGWPHLARALSDLRLHLGDLGVVGVAAGLVFALRRAPKRLAFFLAVPLLQLFLTIQTRVPFPRNLVLLYPVAAALFGAGVIAGARLVCRLAERWPRPRRALPTLGTLLALGWGLTLSAQALARTRSVWSARETRSRAVDILNRRFGAAPHRLGIAAELHLHPQDLRRIELPFTVRPTAELACFPGADTLLLLPAEFEGRGRGDAEKAARLHHLVARTGPVLAEIERGNPLVLGGPLVNPKIAIRRSAPPTAALPADCAVASPEGKSSTGRPRPHHKKRIAGLPAARYPRPN